MADSWLQASLHSVRDLALLASACAAVTRMRANERNITKAACGVGLPCIVKYTLIQSIWGVAVISSQVSLRLLANVLKIEAIPAYIVTQWL